MSHVHSTISKRSFKPVSYTHLDVYKRQIPVSLIVIPAPFRFLEPVMPVRSVIVNQIHDDADIPLLAFSNEFFHIGQGPVATVDGRIITDIVAVVDHGRRIDRRQPDRTDAQGF